MAEQMTLFGALLSSEDECAIGYDSNFEKITAYHDLAWTFFDGSYWHFFDTVELLGAHIASLAIDEYAWVPGTYADLR